MEADGALNNYYSTPLLFIVSLISLKLFKPDSIIRKWQSQLNENGLSGSTINRVTTTLRIVLKQAYRDKKIRRLPVIEAVATSPVGKDIFKPDEIRALFSVDWPDFRFQVGNLLAATTGMRAGEVSALREKYVRPEYIEVIESYDPKFGLHLPKTGKKRIVPIPDKMYEALQKLLSENPHDGENRFIFYSVTPEKPNDPNTFNRALKTAIADILKIEEKDRADRGLTFHSWRHTFNSLLINSRAPLQTVQSITGHLSDEMTELYYHLQQSNLNEIRAIQDTIT